jgi:hypothetical protein
MLGHDHRRVLGGGRGTAAADAAREDAGGRDHAGYQFHDELLLCSEGFKGNFMEIL